MQRVLFVIENELGAVRLARRRSFTGGDLHKFEPNAALVATMTIAAHPPALASPPKCEVCGVRMAYVGKLPAISIKPALRVFLCNECIAIKMASLDTAMP